MKNAICFHAFGHAAGVTSSFVIAAYTGCTPHSSRFARLASYHFWTACPKCCFSTGCYGGHVLNISSRLRV